MRGLGALCVYLVMDLQGNPAACLEGGRSDARIPRDPSSTQKYQAEPRAVNNQELSHPPAGWDGDKDIPCGLCLAIPWNFRCCGESVAAAAALLMGRLFLGVFAKQRLAWNSLHLLQKQGLRCPCPLMPGISHRAEQSWFTFQQTPEAFAGQLSQREHPAVSWMDTRTWPAWQTGFLIKPRRDFSNPSVVPNHI